MSSVELAPALPWIVAGGGWSLAAYFFRLVYTGRMIPMALYLKAVENGEKWEKAYEASEEKYQVLALPSTQLQLQLLRALPPVDNSTGKGT
jgi:hypothetical protein